MGKRTKTDIAGPVPEALGRAKGDARAKGDVRAEIA